MDGADIKIKRRKVGAIQENRWEGKFAVSLMIKIPDVGTAGFRNQGFKARFDSLEAAKQWVAENWAGLESRYPFHYFDE